MNTTELHISIDDLAVVGRLSFGIEKPILEGVVNLV
jgi:hypothetical protein